MPTKMQRRWLKRRQAIEPAIGHTKSDSWSVVRFSPDGNQDRVIGFPVSCPSDVAFGGADGATLYVTTARQPVSLEALGNAPLSGRLFCIDTME